MGATTLALTALLYPFHNQETPKAHETLVAVAPPNETFGMQDFHHFEQRHAHHETSRSHVRHTLPSHQPEATPKPTDMPQPGSNRAIGRTLMLKAGFSKGQWTCLDTLWGSRESGWDVYASNNSSGAYGIPQALPGWKMASEGADWRTNPATQIRWGLRYISSKYGTPCGALNHSYAYGYY